MKLIFLTMFLSLSVMLANTPLIDAKKFSGLWFEIARIENSFQTSCVASSVEYVLQEDNTYDVFNRCFENDFDGKLIQYNGFGKFKDNKLFLRYFYIFTSSYKIEYLNDYQTAVVVNDDYSNVWIMSRKPSINKDELEKILDILKTKIEISSLVFTKLHPKGIYK